MEEKGSVDGFVAEDEISGELSFCVECGQLSDPHLPFVVWCVVWWRLWLVYLRVADRQSCGLRGLPQTAKVLVPLCKLPLLISVGAHFNSANHLLSRRLHPDCCCMLLKSRDTNNSIHLALA